MSGDEPTIAAAVQGDESKGGPATGLRQSTDRRQILIDAACHLVATEGLRDLRLQDVARHAGVATSLIYYYFEDRDSLIRTALEEVGARAEQYTDPGEYANGREALVQSCLDEIQDAEDVRNNNRAWNEFKDASVFDETVRPQFLRLVHVWVAELIVYIRQGQQDGSVAEELDANRTAQTITTLVEGVSTRWLIGSIDTEEAHECLREALDRLVPPGNGNQADEQ